MNTNIHNFLIKNGYKVTSCPDHPTNPRIDVTIYENDDTSIIVEESRPKLKEVIKAINNPKTSHPVTGDVTPSQAKELLFNATRSK